MSLLQIAKKMRLADIPQEVISSIMKNYVDPYHYMETASMFQPDGQHITALLGLDDHTDIVSDSNS